MKEMLKHNNVSGTCVGGIHGLKLLCTQGKLSEKDLSDTFKIVDTGHTGEISYPDFTQAMGRLGVAIPSSEALKLAHQLDHKRSGKIKYGDVHKVLGDAYSREKVCFPAKSITCHRLPQLKLNVANPHSRWTGKAEA